MTNTFTTKFNRRQLLSGSAAMGIAAALPTRFAIAGIAPVKIGILLPYSGTYAMLGNSVTDGFKLRMEMAGNKMGGRPVEYSIIDSEMSVPKAPQNTNKLIRREKVDFIVGPVHSGIAQAMAKIVGKRKGPILVVPNAGSNKVTGELCAPNIFRTSFSNWQPSYPGGEIMAKDGHKTAVTISWKYAAGTQMMDAGKDGFEKNGGTVLKQLYVPFPDVEFQALLSEIASLNPDAVFSFFSGGGAVKFVKDYAASGLKDSIPLYGPGFLTEGVEEAQGEAAEGVRTTLHYSTELDNPTNNTFKATYMNATGRRANVYAVQGYDSASLLLQAAAVVGGDVEATDAVIHALENTHIPDSPRGPWTMSKAHNPIQDIYLREVIGGKHKVLGVAAKALEDPATGCKLV